MALCFATQIMYIMEQPQHDSTGGLQGLPSFAQMAKKMCATCLNPRKLHCAWNDPNNILKDLRCTESIRSWKASAQLLGSLPTSTLSIFAYRTPLQNKLVCFLLCCLTSSFRRQQEMYWKSKAGLENYKKKRREEGQKTHLQENPRCRLAIADYIAYYCMFQLEGVAMAVRLLAVCCLNSVHRKLPEPFDLLQATGKVRVTGIGPAVKATQLLA